MPSPLGSRSSEWWEERRLRLRDLSPSVRSLVWVSIIVALTSGVLVVAVGSGWDPIGGTQYAGFGGEPPRLLVPWSCFVMGTLAGILTYSTTMPGWRFPWMVRLAAGFGGAALAAQTVSMGWVISGGEVDTGAARVVAWCGVAVGLAVAGFPQRLAERWARGVSIAASLPFVLVLLIWTTAGTGVADVIPGVAPMSPQDAFAQAVITIVGALAAGVGVLVLWSLVLSTRGARDIGEGLAAVARPLTFLLPVLLVLKAVWLAMAYGGGFAAGSVAVSRGDGWSAWLLGVCFAAAATWWLLRGQRTRPPTDVVGREVVRWAAIGFAAVFLISVIVGLLSALLIVLPSTSPSAFLNDVLGWLALGDPPIALWTIAATGLLTLVAALVLKRRDRNSGAWIAALVLGLWGAPRAIELVFRIRQAQSPLDAPALATFDTILTVAVLGMAIGWWSGRQTRVPPRVLVLILVVSTLIAHPLGIMPAGWQTGTPFYLLLVYPILYKFLFDSAWVNGLEPELRPGRVLRTTGSIALLVATTSMLVLLGRAGPGIQTVEASVLGAVGEAYLLVPVAALLVAATLRRAHEGNREGALGTQATRRWLWESASERLQARKPSG